VSHIGILTTIISHIIAGVCLQKRRFGKLITALFWIVFGFVSAGVMIFADPISGFFGVLILHAFIFYITTAGSVSEKTFLLLTYLNSFCICIGTSLILSVMIQDFIWLYVATTASVILMNLFLYKVLLPSYRKSRMFFSGWWKLNIALFFFFLQYVNRYAFVFVDRISMSDFTFDFAVFSIIFYLTLILYFDSVKGAAEMKKKTYEINMLKDVAYVDALTHIPNRTAYENFIKKQMTEYGKSSTTHFVCVVLDVDGFKGINDTKGHDEGDRILELVGRVLIQHFGNCNGGVFRFGGDEFVLLLQDMQAPEVESRLKVLNEDVFKLTQIRLSYGYADVEFGIAEPFDAAFKAADANMYAHKQNKKFNPALQQ